jgi:hypothetical protein
MHPDVARVIGQLADHDDPVAVMTLRRALARAWPEDRDAEFLSHVIEPKPAGLRLSD